MTTVDRTSEFKELCTTYRVARPPSLKAPPPPAQPPVELHDFHEAASSISSEIHVTTQKLIELSKLVKESSRSLFNDQTDKISNYVHSISEDITALNNKLQSAEQYVDDKKKKLGSKNQVADHSVQVVDVLRTSLFTTTKTFKEVVKQRTESQKHQQERKKAFGSAKESRLTLGRPKVYNPAALPRPSGVRAAAEEAFPSPQNHSMVVHRRQMRMQEQAPLIPDQSYFESRAQAVEDIESSIQQLGGIFERLTSMVASHQELTERLHENVTDAVENTELAHQRLLRTLHQLTSNRSVAYKISFVLFVFLVFFIVFLL